MRRILLFIPWAAILVLTGCHRDAEPADDASKLRYRIAQLESNDEVTRLGARLALMEEGEAAEPFLLGALKSENAEARFQASAALRGLSRKLSERALPDLVRATGDEDLRVRNNAVETLGMMGAKAGPAADALRDARRDSSDLIARAAVLALARVRGAGAVPELIPLLKDRRFKFAAANALELIGPPAAEAIPALETLRCSENPADQGAAQLALWAIRGAK